VPALPPYLIEPIWEQFRALLPERRTSHPLGCHRSRIPQRVVFEKLVQILVFGCAYERIADASCSESTLRRRRDEWIELGVMDRLRQIWADLPRCLRPPHRVGALGGGGGLLHHQGPLWRGEGGKKPGG
jgi:transposase